MSSKTMLGFDRLRAALVAGLLVLGAVMLVGGDAWAGIIITEGDVPSSCTDKFDMNGKKGKKTGRRGTSGCDDGKSELPMSKAGNAPADPTPTDGGVPVGDDESEVDTFLAALDAPVPDGYDCKDIGGGVQLCKKSEDAEAGATGAGPGSGAGGSLSADSYTDDAGDPAVGGCQGGSAPDAALWFALGALALVTRRRMLTA